MTQEVARVVASMLRSHDRFSVDDGEVWLPDLDSYSFTMQEHLARALELHGYAASPSARSHAGLTIDVPEAEPVDEYESRSLHTAGYGYTGRVAGIEVEGQPATAHFDEPGSVLAIPDLGWTDGRERVVIGRHSGVHLAEVHTDAVETFEGEETFEIETMYGGNREMMLHELAEDGRVIVYRGEWNGYPQERF